MAALGDLAALSACSLHPPADTERAARQYLALIRNGDLDTAVSQLHRSLQGVATRDTFAIEGATFVKLHGGQSSGPHGVNALYMLSSFDSAVNNQGALLAYANIIPIRSTLVQLGPNNYSGGFVQNGRAGGTMLHP